MVEVDKMIMKRVKEGGGEGMYNFIYIYIS